MSYRHRPESPTRTTHVLHGTERRVPLDPALLVEPRGHLVVERHGVVPRTLSTSVKVLTSVFGNPDGLLDLIVVVGDVALEVFGLDKEKELVSDTFCCSTPPTPPSRLTETS